jgi:nicotinate-nucleotide adenylyltransferase
MKIGLYFGSFNPIHIGHLIIANHFAEHADLNQVWIMVTPQNPLKQKQTLLDNYQRLQLVHLAVADYDNIKASDFEFNLPQPNYTIHTLNLLSEKYPTYDFSLIMGADNLETLHKWKNYEAILDQYSIYVYPRIGKSNINNNFKNHPKIKQIDAPIVEISATFIRQQIKLKKNIKPLLPEKVWAYIIHNNLYQK